MRCLGGALLLALAVAPAKAVIAAIVVDGRLDEPAWQTAQVLSEFGTTDPYTLAEPALRTEVRILSTEDGLYLGFTCDQPPGVERVRTIGQRDQFVPGDRVNAMIDFDGSGTTGYEFTVLLGGAQQDAIISRQNSYNYDWDGDWSYAVSESADRWFVEYRIPWNIAPLGDDHDGKREIGVFASRVVVQTAHRYSQPPNVFTRSTFVADMQKVTVDAHRDAQLDLFPYVGGSRDILAGDSEGRAGLDVVWKPDGQNQFVATVHPDFGQVESDQLVVNFSAIPSFFPDKRPFFTENFDLFSTPFNVLYTRRIGAVPDGEIEGASDILGAVKYTGGGSRLQYGAIVAVEEDSGTAEGRDFYVARTRYKLNETLSLGAMGTHTERPTLEREADVAAADFAWTFAPGARLSGQGVLSDVSRTATGTFDDFLDPGGTGSGARMLFSYAPGGRVESNTVVISKNPDFNINDAGYQSRPDEHLLETINTFFWRDWSAQSSIRDQNLRFQGDLFYNDHGVRRPGYVQLTWNVNRRDTRNLGLQYQIDSIGGEDDLLTEGNGNVKLPVLHRLDAFYQSAQTGLFRYYTQIGAGESFYQDLGFHLFYMEPGLYPSDALSITSVLEFWDFADKPIWDPTYGAVGVYDYEQQYASLNLNWFPVARHEFRLKFQWVAASGAFLGAYLPDADGNLQPTGDPIGDFSFTTTAMQLRYRFEFAPQSEFFAVYSRGGYDELADTERNQATAFRRGLSEETDSLFLLKLRYRFSLLD